MERSVSCVDWAKVRAEDRSCEFSNPQMAPRQLRRAQLAAAQRPVSQAAPASMGASAAG